MNKKGFTLVELLAVIVILAIILAIAVPSISNMINASTKSAMESDAKLVLKALGYKKLQDDNYNPDGIIDVTGDLGISSDNYESVTISNVSGKYKVVIVGKNKWAGWTAYGTFKDMKVVKSSDVDFTPPVITLIGLNPMEIEQGSNYNEPGAIVTDNKDSSLSVVMSGTVNINVLGTYTISYNVSDSSGNAATPVTRTVNVVIPNYSGPNYKSNKGVNGPALAKGMVPIKWNGSIWIDTDVYDSTWYNYTTTDKQWANARTQDGSMWVWIPRYAYQIASGYHTSTAGTINVKFLKDNTNTASDGTIVALSPTYSGSSQTNYVNHPAFTFGTTELTGIWVAKFETSGTTSSLDSKPGVVFLRSITVGNMFIASRNMETNNRYGWGLASGLNADGTFTADTNNVDTHMMKNIEWGAVSYLSKSVFGKNAEITINGNTSYYTGGGSGAAYVTNVGQSTTGNIYGIYDISGGAFEYVMGNYNNVAGSSGLTPSSIVNKYIDRYTAYDSTKHGDAIYETSTSTSGNTSWYSDYSTMISSSNPWFLRGGGYVSGTNAGAFYFNAYTGGAYGDYSWRSVVLVGAGL